MFNSGLSVFFIKELQQQQQQQQQHIEWYHVWRPSLTSKRSARVCQHLAELLVLLGGGDGSVSKDIEVDNRRCRYPTLFRNNIKCNVRYGKSGSSPSLRQNHALQCRPIWDSAKASGYEHSDNAFVMRPDKNSSCRDIDLHLSKKHRRRTLVGLADI